MKHVNEAYLINAVKPAIQYSIIQPINTGRTCSDITGAVFRLYKHKDIIGVVINETFIPFCKNNTLVKNPEAVCCYVYSTNLIEEAREHLKTTKYIKEISL